MTQAEIIFIVQCETGFAWSEITKANSGPALAAKYVAISMLNEEGYKPAQIAEIIHRKRQLVYHALHRIEKHLTYKSTKPADIFYKKMYLDCIRYMAEREEGYAAA